ncbi:uncharacterized protein HMPREF1541_04388 [Cyphellophora europaea CBS 101466]|uniref:rRNA biogenesis protein RRP36 n=1 Tax=Cyphellophora europaea (strain CBS 101466) TaxID=1220924 RepID=W2RWG4_CYPE1|nr:uncharacterized protein HMPREF1541_04388 [Cyphellophora europaea CBS 101466]ETN40113.1 hypothetical protein HMPREF1541_04388 [Cyphellophora europaea CBS 101466]
MALKSASRGPIRLRPDVVDDEKLNEFSHSSDYEDEPSNEGSTSGSGETESESEDESDLLEGVAQTSEAGNPDDAGQESSKSALNDISFGVLAEAQERYAPPSKKRKWSQNAADPGAVQEDNDQKSQNRAKDMKKPNKISRTSKHAPTVLSSRQQVSRKRDVFEPSPAIKSRDPRFDPTIMSSTFDKNTVDKANKNYAFLTTYQAVEILDLKAQIKKTKDPELVAALKRKVMSAEAKIRNAEARQRESKIVTEHNQKEREAIRAGQKAKPYYLKPGEIRKQAEEERVASMGKRARDKAEKRKKKREKSKDAKNMPRFRRDG